MPYNGTIQDVGSLLHFLPPYSPKVYRVFEKSGASFPVSSDIQPPIFTPAFTKDATAQTKHRHTLPQCSRESYIYVD